MIKRLNENFLRQDLEEYLNEQICSGYKGSFSDVIEWMVSYSRNIVFCKKEIVDRFYEVFPRAVIRIEPSYDDNSIYMINIYGIDIGKENHKIAHDLSEEIYEEYKSTYVFCLHILDIEKTEKYYSEIYQELVKKNTP